MHYDIEATTSGPNDQSRLGAAYSIYSKPDNSNLPPSPILKRRVPRSNIFKTVNEHLTQLNWHPGQEPGLDPSKSNGGRHHIPTLHEECQITVVDFSEEDMRMRDMDNVQLIDFLQDQENWIRCRWINFNGLSWDVIQALGKYKKLHRLKVENLKESGKSWQKLVGEKIPGYVSMRESGANELEGMRTTLILY